MRQDDAALGVVILSGTIDICLNLLLGLRNRDRNRLLRQPLARSQQ
jgi:hypothetical protein